MKRTDPQREKFYLLSSRVTALSLFLLGFIFAWREISSHDIGFHLKAGDWIVANLRFPDKDVFSYTAGTHDYIDLHWMYQLIVSTINKLYGEVGLVASNAAFILLSFIVVFVRSTRKKAWSELSGNQLLLFLGIWSVAFLFELRPNVLSWLYLNLLLLVLEDYYERRKNNLLLVPLIMLLWTNTHSMFVLGWLVIGCFLLGIMWTERKIWTAFTPYALASIAISFVNPYFLRGVEFPFYQFGFLQPENIFKGTIKELASPFNLESYTTNGRFVLVQPLFPFHLFFLISVAGFLSRLKRIQLHELLLFLFFAYLAISAVKNIGFFVFAVLPATIAGLQVPEAAADPPGETLPPAGLLESIGEWWNSMQTRLVINGATIIACVVMIAAVMTNAYYINYRSNDRFGFRYNNLTLPYEAARFIQRNQLNGRILNQFNFGGYLMHALPQQVSIDGRNEVYGEEFYAQYSLLWDIPSKRDIIEKYDPQIIIFPFQYEFLWVHFLLKDSAWRLVYVDELAAVYIKRGVNDALPLVNEVNVAGSLDRIPEPGIDSVLRRRDPGEPSLFSVREHYFPQPDIGLSTFCYYADWFDDAIQIGLHGMLRSTVPCPEAYYNLGHYFFEKKDYDRSEYCYARFLKTNSDPVAQQRVLAIQHRK